MVKFLVFILSLGFTLQATGAADWLQKNKVQSVQLCGEEKSEVEKRVDNCKKSIDKIQDHHLLREQLQLLYTNLENTVTDYPSGVRSKPFMPPR